uniref:Uncharacterized protein n=1 Tax=Lactuca sativa TaxID=4236 RepID=A0A9R1WW17_LACSA|nr:hypothetical protein LSAT_V11C800416740 [Lactuca sativa]
MTLVRQPNELRIFYRFLCVSIFLALFIMGMAIAQNIMTAYAGSASMVISVLFVPLFMAIKEELNLWVRNKHQPVIVSEVKIENMNKNHEYQSTNPTSLELNNPNPKPKAKTSCFANVFLNKPERGEDYNILQALLSTYMLILFVNVFLNKPEKTKSTFCGLGTSLTAVDNLGQIGESLGYPTMTIKSFVSLLSIWNYFGRIFAGFVSEILLVKYKFPRALTELKKKKGRRKRRWGRRYQRWGSLNELSQKTVIQK